MESRRIYFDHAATTPVDPRVVSAMSPYFSDDFGNPSSIHLPGQRANAALEEARTKVAWLLGCDAEEIVFTSCGSESNNLAIRGVALAERQRRGANHILTTSVEHPAVLETASQMSRFFDFEIEILPVDEHGIVDPEAVASRLRAETALVSIIHANNEIGSINPVSAIAKICHQQNIPFHTDAVQSAGQLSPKVDDLQVDLLSISAHKFYGPKGVGALYVRKGTAVAPILTGGQQEGGLRAGTQNVPLIIGLAQALSISDDLADSTTKHYLDLRDRIIAGVLESIPNVQLTGHPTQRLPNHASFVIKDVDANRLLAALDLAGFACSSGSACHTGSPEPSLVLSALGLPTPWALGSLRLTMGRSSTGDDVDAFLSLLPEVIARLRSTGETLS